MKPHVASIAIVGAKPKTISKLQWKLKPLKIILFDKKLTIKFVSICLGTLDD